MAPNPPVLGLPDPHLLARELLYSAIRARASARPLVCVPWTQWIPPPADTDASINPERAVARVANVYIRLPAAHCVGGGWLYRSDD